MTLQIFAHFPTQVVHGCRISQLLKVPPKCHVSVSVGKYVASILGVHACCIIMALLLNGLWNWLSNFIHSLVDAVYTCCHSSNFHANALIFL